MRAKSTQFKYELREGRRSDRRDREVPKRDSSHPGKHDADSQSTENRHLVEFQTT